MKMRYWYDTDHEKTVSHGKKRFQFGQEFLRSPEEVPEEVPEKSLRSP